MRLLEFLERKEPVSLPSESAEIAIGNLRTGTIPQQLPIDAKTSEWMTHRDPERLVKTFKFKSKSQMSYFINELMAYQEDTNHHSKIIIDFRDVTIETYTHDLDSVTRQDINLAKFCDEIYEDILFLDYSRKK
tara:strand:+ start:1600 stop:1998 length:399 start_codon:yes stop_codon:yes gene_type:complete